ncbi:MAG TPA: hypothetical protein VK645_15745 [Chitinophagaceae bacterium]|nr:hypothetical protein [Chitinophagaceae bacterium]
MTFTYAHALELIRHYQFLKGRDMQGGNETPVTELAVAPVNDDQLAAFFTEFKTTKNAKKALDAAGYDKSQVQVVLLNEEDDKIDLWEEIDSYLEENKLERVYLNPDFFKQ